MKSKKYHLFLLFFPFQPKTNLSSKSGYLKHDYNWALYYQLAYGQLHTILEAKIEFKQYYRIVGKIQLKDIRDQMALLFYIFVKYIIVNCILDFAFLKTLARIANLKKACYHDLLF